MQYESFAIILASAFDKNLLCVRCEKPKQLNPFFEEKLCDLCKEALALHNCQGCSGLIFENQKCDVCEADQKEENQKVVVDEAADDDWEDDDCEQEEECLLDALSDEDDDEFGLFNEDEDDEDEDEDDEDEDEDDEDDLRD